MNSSIVKLDRKLPGIKIRYRRDKIFFGVCSLFCLFFLLLIFFLIGGLIYDGYTAFIRSNIYITDGGLDSLEKKIKTEYNLEWVNRKMLTDLLSNENEKLHNGWYVVNSDVDLYIKDILFRHVGFTGMLTDREMVLVQELHRNGDLKLKFNSNLFTKGDSVYPENTGILVSLTGSIITVLIAIIFVFPIGIITAFYIGEFARKSFIAFIVELSIKSLASVPSIVIGVFGLSVYIGLFHLPRSSVIVSGLTLGIIALPLIVITTKQALMTVPNSIKYTALSLGASPLHVLWRHSLPMSVPIIITGFMLSVARIIGETAPLLMIGGIIFVKEFPLSLTDSVTTLPAQVYLWSKNSHYGFTELISATILLLITIIAFLNILSFFIKRRYKRKYYV